LTLLDEAPDGAHPKAGERHAQSLLGLIAPVRSVRWLKLESDKQPTDYAAAFFRDRLGV
jgi:hypothetical protein